MNADSNSLKGKLLGTSTLKNGTGTYTELAAHHDKPTVTRRIEYLEGKIVSEGR